MRVSEPERPHLAEGQFPQFLNRVIGGFALLRSGGLDARVRRHLVYASVRAYREK